MRILAAAEDRDLARCVRELLSDAETAVDTVFDGAQVLSAVAAERYDLLILTQSLPRVPWETVAVRVRATGMPVILLLQETLTARRLTEPAFNDCLALPFLPSELVASVRSVTEKSRSDSVFAVGAVPVAVSSFRLGGAPVTAAELDLLAALAAGEAVTDDAARPYVQALNAKFAAQHLPCRIRYIIKEGYRLENDHE